MKDKVVVITGASDGIGAAAARRLHALQAHVVLHGRSEQKTKAIAGELGAPYYLADFARLDEVRGLADWLRKEYGRIDVLINNAGGILAEREQTPDGFEKTFQVNYLAHFLLTHTMLDILVRSKASVVCTSSVAHWLGRIHLDEPNLEKGYWFFQAYANTKLELILLAGELHSRFHSQGLSSAAVHPGAVYSNFGRESIGLLRFAYQTKVGSKVGFFSPQKGADPLVWLASSKPGEEWRSGEYYSGCRVAWTSRPARDPWLRQALWEKSEEILGR